MHTYTLDNGQIQMSFVLAGASIVSLGRSYNYLLSYSNIEDYQDNPLYLGTMVGRNAGRTSPNYYTNHLGQKVILDINEEPNTHLHGGNNNMKTVIWNLISITDTKAELSYQDINSVYEPMEYFLTYELIEDAFHIHIKGKSDVPTISNLTNHLFVNLNENKQESILSHHLKMAPATLQIIDKDGISTGSYSRMEEDSAYHAYNFTQDKQVATAYQLDNEMSRRAKGGLDFAFRFDEINPSIPQLEVSSSDHKHGIRIYSNQESCVIYTMNVVDEEYEVNHQGILKPYTGITFEMQRLPNFVHETTDSKDTLTSDYDYHVIYELY